MVWSFVYKHVLFFWSTLQCCQTSEGSFSPPMPMGPERQGWSRECLSQQCHRSACPSPPLLLLYLASSLIPELASHQGAVGLGLPLTHREKFCCYKPVKTLFSSCRKSLFFIHITHLIQFSPTSCATPID